MARFAHWSRGLGVVALLVATAVASCSDGDAGPPCLGASCLGDAACDGGACGGAGGASPCGPGLAPCGETCVDITSDAAHCGACDLPCPEGWTCEAEICVAPCAAQGLALCGRECVDVTSDEANCGACQSPCLDDQQCVASACQCIGVCGKCGLVPLLAPFPIDVAGSTVGLTDQWQSACGGAGSPDASYTFTVPQSGHYVFETDGSSLDTVLSLMDPACAELACNDDWNGPSSRQLAFLTTGDEILVGVDGKGGAAGSFSLHVRAVTCPMTELGSSVPQVTGGATTGLPDDLAASCGGAATADATIGFTAPYDGLFQFHTAGSAFDTILAARQGSCLGPEIACNDDTDGTASSLSLNLQAGEVIVLQVTGAAGAEGFYMLTAKDAVTPVCDQLPCGLAYDECMGCAILESCAAEYHACEMSVECVDYSVCLQACADAACVAACTTANPPGAALYGAAFDCIVCQSCYGSCDGASSGCP